jgi:hypothetical protein
MKMTKKSAAGPVDLWQQSDGERDLVNKDSSVRIAEFYLLAIPPNNVS